MTRTLDFRPMDFGDKEFPGQVGVLWTQPHDWTVFKTHPGWLGHIRDEILPSYTRIISHAILMIPLWTNQDFMVHVTLVGFVAGVAHAEDKKSSIWGCGECVGLLSEGVLSYYFWGGPEEPLRVQSDPVDVCREEKVSCWTGWIFQRDVSLAAEFSFRQILASFWVRFLQSSGSSVRCLFDDFPPQISYLHPEICETNTKLQPFKHQCT